MDNSNYIKKVAPKINGSGISLHEAFLKYFKIRENQNQPKKNSSED